MGPGARPGLVPSNNNERDSMNVMWFAPVDLVLAAQGLGLSGMDAVEYGRTRGSDHQFEQLSAGQCDAVITSMDNVIAWNRRSSGPGDFRIVAQIERTTPVSVIAHPSLASLAELRGGSLLVDAPGNGFVIALRALLKLEGLGLNDYRLVEVGGVKERAEAILAGQGDATLLGAGFTKMAVAAGLKDMGSVQDRFPRYPGQGVVVSQRALPKYQATLVRWLQALQEACRRHERSPAEVAEALHRGGGFDAAGITNAQRLIPATLHPEPEGVALLIGMRRDLGLPGAEDGFEDLVRTDLLPS
jgi:ABC-type nitrate/sulfonate/bicarbonate transport system substrate-binding protein